MAQALTEDTGQTPEDSGPHLNQAQGASQRAGADRGGEQPAKLGREADPHPVAPIRALVGAFTVRGCWGGVKNVDGALVVPVITMVDNREHETLAREAAEQALTLTQRFDRIVLTTLRSTQPIVDIVYRR
jgi:hypothetical protein